MVPLIGFQGLLNKWVNINKSNSEGGRKKLPRSDVSMRSGNTAASTVVTAGGNHKTEGQQNDEVMNTKTPRCKSFNKKLTRTDSYSDILRKKREQAQDAGSYNNRRDADSLWITPCDDRYYGQEKEKSTRKTVENGRLNKWGEVISTHVSDNTVMQEQYCLTPLDRMLPMEVTLEQLFNPLAPPSEINHLLGHHDSLPAAICSSGSTANSEVIMPQELTLRCPSASQAHPHPIMQDGIFPAETQFIPCEADAHHYETQYNTPFHPCPNCRDLEHKLNDMTSRLEYYCHPHESSLAAETVCEKCGATDSSPAKKQGGSGRQYQLTPSMPIFTCRDLKTERDHYESIALMEASQRLVEFMTMHKRQMEQLTRERVSSYACVFLYIFTIMIC